MRGTRIAGRVGFTHLGIIPAYAGNTCLPVPVLVPAGDHPRVCGEHAAGEWKWYYDKGSSPRMRGTRHGFICRLLQPGIIPAYAGNTQTNRPGL